MKQIKTIKIGKFSRTKETEFDPSYYDKNRMTGVIYGNKDQSIKKKSTVTIETPKKTITKTKTYSPISYYGNQTKVKTKVVKRK